jgi:hypothetical protein
MPCEPIKFYTNIPKEPTLAPYYHQQVPAYNYEYRTTPTKKILYHNYEYRTVPYRTVLLP